MLPLLTEIVELATSVINNLQKGTPLTTPSATAAIMEIIQNALRAYQTQTGDPIDPSIIKVEDWL